MNYIPIIIESRMKVDVETIQHKEYIDFCLNTNPTLIYQLLLDVVEMDNEDLIDYMFDRYYWLLEPKELMILSSLTTQPKQFKLIIKDKFNLNNDNQPINK